MSAKQILSKPKTHPEVNKTMAAFKSDFISQFMISTKSKKKCFVDIKQSFSVWTPEYNFKYCQIQYGGASHTIYWLNLPVSDWK